MRPFRFETGAGGIGAIPFPDYNLARVLAASTNESITVPTGAAAVELSGTADFWARIGGTAAIPAADVTDGTASVLNPDLIYAVEPGQTIGVISAVAGCLVSARFWAGQQ